MTVAAGARAVRDEIAIVGSNQGAHHREPADTRIGVSAKDLPRLFDMFEQVGAALGKVRSGLGIGLSLARGLVEMHGVSIEASSEGSGKGTEFRVRLPILGTPSEAAAPPASQREEPRPAAARRILVVDDSSDVAVSLAVYLRMTGNEVETAHDGLEGVAAAERFRPEVVLLDIGMPTLDGHDACRTMRERPWGKAMVIVALSGCGQDDDRRRSKEAGFDAHLVKPIDLATIQRLLVDPRAFQG